jgi:xanthine dehydrogenase YagS FAD-binding subunit
MRVPAHQHDRMLTHGGSGPARSARIVLGGVAPIPWRLPKVEAMLVGQRITPELAAPAGEASIEGAHPLAKNKYKVPLTKAVVKRTLLSLTA